MKRSMARFSRLVLNLYSGVNKNRHLIALFALLAVIVFAGNSYAGTTGTEFQGVYDLIKGWATGYLGRIIALGTFIVGLGVMIIRQSLLPVVAGLAVAITVAFGPTVIEGIASAVF